jgi:GDP/UDP-N,N'-diacetylbacillosamine 2-epimerase (hydrolysing)
MGEEPWRVFNVGEAGIENIKRLKFMSKQEMEKELSIKFNKKMFLITYHPVTLDVDNIEEQIDNLLKAISRFNAIYIFTYPNADFGSKIIINKIEKFSKKNDNANIFYNLGQKKYLSLLNYIDVMVGNSSSGIIESPFFKLPVVNVGDRQKGRIKNKNIIDTGYSEMDIYNGIYKALYDEKFKYDLEHMKNIYGDGTTSEQIVYILKSINLNKKLIGKRLTY